MKSIMKYLVLATSASALKLLTMKEPLDMEAVAGICEKVKCNTVTCQPPFKLEFTNKETGLPSCCGICKAPEDIIPLPTTFFKSQYLVDPCEKKPDTCNHDQGHDVQCFQQSCADGEEIQCGKDACCPMCGKWEYKFVDNAWNYYLPA